MKSWNGRIYNGMDAFCFQDTRFLCPRNELRFYSTLCNTLRLISSTHCRIFLFLLLFLFFFASPRLTFLEIGIIISDTKKWEVKKTNKTLSQFLVLSRNFQSFLFGTNYTLFHYYSRWHQSCKSSSLSLSKFLKAKIISTKK